MLLQSKTVAPKRLEPAAAKVVDVIDGKRVWAIERRLTRTEIEEAEARVPACYKWPFPLDDFQVRINTHSHSPMPALTHS